ncbi:MAG: serine/threonine-protein kinase [Candidatus Krumholzibacteria bacterium]|nr:serine/threonine-protein kinase [Candidatus Krumholzibacteria bacterium]
MQMVKLRRIRVGQRIGKYKLMQRIGDGAFGVVYRARDEVEGTHVALKIHERTDDVEDILRFFKKEIQLLSRVDHRNILKLKNADIFDKRLYIVSELGRGSLEERERRRMTVSFAVGVLRQILEALIEVQKHNIVHRDIKPGNIILFPDNVVKLGDFGIAKVLERAGQSIGTDAGTRGYFAPEQIYGHPSFASDIFSLGLVFYEMITGALPRWPFEWPFDGKDKFNRSVEPRLRRVVKRALEFEEGDRYPDAVSMQKALLDALDKRNNGHSNSRRRLMPWRKYRELEFSTRFSNLLVLKFKCGKCAGPISEYMLHCPWCGTDKNSFKGLSSFTAVCRRCEHGVKDEWDYCPWCYRKKFAWADVWVTSDKRYVKNCPNRYCGERKIMRWMRYCPWCHTKLKPWILRQLDGRCKKCSWSVAADYWDYCAWCGESIP